MDGRRPFPAALWLVRQGESLGNVADAQAKYPDRILWFTSLPLEYPQRAIEVLERSCAKGGVGFDIVPGVSSISGVPAKLTNYPKV